MTKQADAQDENKKPLEHRHTDNHEPVRAGPNKRRRTVVNNFGKLLSRRMKPDQATATKGSGISQLAEEAVITIEAIHQKICCNTQRFHCRTTDQRQPRGFKFDFHFLADPASDSFASSIISLRMLRCCSASTVIFILSFATSGLASSSSVARFNFASANSDEIFSYCLKSTSISICSRRCLMKVVLELVTAFVFVSSTID